MAWIADKRVVVTGATSGLGKQLAARLASLGAHVVLACRDPLRGAAAAADINAGAEAKRATVMTVDTADPASVAAFARDYRDAYGALDVLVNNAGALFTDRQVGSDGIELTFATNVLGYYLVTTGLLDALTAAEPSRVVNVASTYAGHLDLEDLQFDRRAYDGMAAYAQSKACDRMLTWAFARRLDGQSVAVNAMAPGLMLDTRLYRELSTEAKRELAAYGSRTVSEGAETAVRLASSPELDGVTGRFFEQGTEVPCEFRDEAAGERLWQICEQLAQQLAPSPD